MDKTSDVYSVRVSALVVVALDGHEHLTNVAIFSDRRTRQVAAVGMLFEIDVSGVANTLCVTVMSEPQM
jgi:hypothetical protein